MGSVFSPQRSGGVALFAVQRGVVDGSVTAVSIAALGAVAYSGTVSMTVDVLPATNPRCTLSLTTDGVTPASSITGLQWAWYDNAPPVLTLMPTVTGTGASTNAEGVFDVELVGTSLLSGQTGTLLLVKNTGVAGDSDNLAFCAPVVVS